jgi:hypothetical protein
MIKLAKIAHSRAGDKGNILMLSIIPFEEKDYEWLLKEVTAEKVKAHLSHLIKGEVIRYEIPGIHALQFTCYQALGPGVTTSLALDAHGKSLSYALLEIEIE